MKILIFIGLFIGFFACIQGQKKVAGDQVLNSPQVEPTPDLNDQGITIKERFRLPDGYQRVEVEPGSYQDFLRHLHLKPPSAKVHFYHGGIKENHGVYAGVVDMDVGKKDLQQCADAIIRLRGEYLYAQQRFEDIHFNFTNGFRVDYSKWRAGNSIEVSGNKTWWVENSQSHLGYDSFRDYLDLIFTYAGTLSLAKELETVDIENLSIGDVFIQGGSPGHGIIIVDLASHLESGEKIFLLAQSYMPAQEIQVLLNPNDAGISPWYTDQFEGPLTTPEWTFNKSDLKRFSQ